MSNVCVFCGSQAGVDARWGEQAEEVGRTIATCGSTLVYGGSSRGLMGRMADAALSAGGTVIGVLPQSLIDRELAHPGLTRLEIVPDLMTRKERMIASSSRFVAMPGGIGTLDELFEVWTLGVIRGVHRPLALYDATGFFDPLVTYLDHATTAGFVTAEVRRRLVALDRIDALRMWLTERSA